MKGLTRKQAAFVGEYLIDLNAAQAAIRAGYSAKTAKDIGCQNLAKLNVASAIQAAMQERMEQVKVDAAYVLRRLIAIDEMDVADILDGDGSIRPVKDWPKIWRQYISGMDVSEMFAEGGVAGMLKKIKWPDKVRNLELLGKHVDVQAFKDKVEHSGALDLAMLTEEQLLERRNRLISPTE